MTRMTVAKIPYEFITQRVELRWNEIKFGLDHQLIKPKVAIAKALEQLCDTDTAPKEVVELAALGESEPVADLVTRLAEVETPSSSVEYVNAKWLYLLLAWLFEYRESLVDPMTIVEEVYADFNYPREIAPFIRYMPMDAPDLGNQEQNEARMFDRWKAYLDNAAKRFARPARE